MGCIELVEFSPEHVVDIAAAVAPESGCRGTEFVDEADRDLVRGEAFADVLMTR